MNPTERSVAIQLVAIGELIAAAEAHLKALATRKVELQNTAKALAKAR